MARGRAANGSGTQPRKRSDGRWEVRFSIGIDPGTGKTIMKSLYGKTADEVAEKLRRFTSEVDTGDYLEPSKLKVAEWMNIWLKDYNGHTTPGTLVLYKGYVKNHIIPGIGALQIAKLQPHQVQHFVNNLKYQGKKSEKQMSYKTRKNIHGCLSAALEKAKELKYIKENPATGCSIPRNDDVETSEEINPFSEDELTAFMEAAKGSYFEDIYHVAANTGMRLSEILGLRWSRFNQARAKITVDCQLLIKREKGSQRKLAPTKNKKNRSFKIAPSVVALLNRIKTKQAQNKLKAGSAWQYEIPDLIFTDEIGGTIPHASVEHEFKRITTEIGCPDHRFHDLRHTFATLALQHGADVKTLSEALGHYSVAFTLDVYGHVSEEMSNSFAALMENVITARKNVL